MAGFFNGTMEAMTTAGGYDGFLFKVPSGTGGATAGSIALGALVLLAAAGAGWFIYSRKSA
jgi:hypothetical protein